MKTEFSKDRFLMNLRCGVCQKRVKTNEPHKCKWFAKIKYYLKLAFTSG